MCIIHWFISSESFFAPSKVNVAVRRDRDESTVSLGGTCAGGVVVSDSQSVGTGCSAGWPSRQWTAAFCPATALLGAQLACKRSAVDNACYRNQCIVPK